MNERNLRSSLDLLTQSVGLPVLIEAAGEQARERFIEFFTASIRNRGTRAVYANAVQRFLYWCLLRNIGLAEIKPVVVATYVEQLTLELQAPTVKVHLAAIRRLFDFLVTGHIIMTNPASSVRGSRHVVKKGSTPVLLADEARQLLGSIDVGTIVGLRGRNELNGILVVQEN